jgi:hypothetical protein
MKRLSKSTGRAERGKLLRTPANDNPSPEQQPPVFSLCYLQAGRYCLSSCERYDKAAFADKLHRLSQLTWGQIKSQHHHKLGYERIPRKQIRAGIPRHITDDVDSFMVFRFSGMKAMAGYRDGDIFYVLWLDRDFSLYDHG